VAAIYIHTAGKLVNANLPESGACKFSARNVARVPVRAFPEMLRFGVLRPARWNRYGLPSGNPPAKQRVQYSSPFCTFDSRWLRSDQGIGFDSMQQLDCCRLDQQPGQEQHVCSKPQSIVQRTGHISDALRLPVLEKVACIFRSVSTPLHESHSAAEPPARPSLLSTLHGIGSCRLPCLLKNASEAGRQPLDTLSPCSPTVRVHGDGLLALSVHHRRRRCQPLPRPSRSHFGAPCPGSTFTYSKGIARSSLWVKDQYHLVSRMTKLIVSRFTEGRRTEHLTGPSSSPHPTPPSHCLPQAAE